MILIDAERTVYEVRKQRYTTSKAVGYVLYNGSVVWVPNRAVQSNSTADVIYLKPWFRITQ